MELGYVYVLCDEETNVNWEKRGVRCFGEDDLFFSREQVSFKYAMSYILGMFRQFLCFRLFLLPRLFWLVIFNEKIKINLVFDN